MNLPAEFPAPAKLNLFLRVVGRRADGYHPLQTLFRFIDHADSLRFELRPDPEIVLETPLPGVGPEAGSHGAGGAAAAAGDRM